MMIDSAALDRHITGNWGEDQYKYCGKPMQDGNCQMDTDHKGRHSTVTFYCDICGKTRRGYPHVAVMDRQSDGYSEHVADVCFMCAVVEVRKHEDDNFVR